MTKENKVLTIDIGGENLKMAEFHYPETGGMVMHAFAFRKMVREEGESSRDMFSRYYNELIAEGGFTATNVRLSLSSQNSFQRLSKLPPVLGNRDAIDRLIEFEASQTMPYAIEDIEWGYQLLYHEWDEMVPEEQEDGSIAEISVHRSENEALFIAMKSDDVVPFTEVIEDSGKVVLSVDAAPVALFNAAMAAQIKDDECALLVNIGGGATSLMIADKHRVFMRNIPTAGESVTAQIAREFSIDANQAEDFKRRYGFVALGGAYEEPESELASKISKITRNVMTRLHGEISRSVSLWRAQHGGSAPTRILLAGGGSTMQYTTEFFNEKLRIPAEYLNTFPLIGIGSGVDKNLLQSVAPMSQALIGLGLRELGHAPLDISLLPKVIKKQFDLNSRKPFLYAAVGTLISSLLIFVFGLMLLRTHEQNRVAAIQQDVVKAENETKKIQQLNSELLNLQGQFDESMNFLRDRNTWARMISEIQRKMPANVWLVALEYDGDRKLNTVDTGESLGGEEDGMNLNKADDPNKRMPLKNISNLQNITKVRLVGYARDNHDDGGASINAFIEALRKESPEAPSFFDVNNVNLNRNRVDGVYNLSYFEIILTLKEQLRK